MLTEVGVPGNPGARANSADETDQVTELDPRRCDTCGSTWLSSIDWTCMRCEDVAFLGKVPAEARAEAEKLIDEGKPVHAIKVLYESVEPRNGLRPAINAMHELSQNRRNSSGSIPRNAS
jgi:hypothetical protein